MDEIDPITREIMQNALASAADEMSLALYRTAYSTIVRDCLDYSTSLCDASGEMIAQSVTIPLHMGAVPFAMATLFKKYGDAIHEGDIFIMNDPFDGGMHIPDIFIVKPIFWGGERIAFVVSTAHHMDSDGVGGPPVRFEVSITIAGDSVTADFTGTDPQVRGALNSTLSFTTSAVALCVRSMLQEQIPNTAGIFRPLTIIAPPGTVVNGVMPAASSMRGVTGFRIIDTVLGALSSMLPNRVPAAGEGGNSLVIIGGQRPDRSSYVYYELLAGSWGGRPSCDGNDGLCTPANVASNIPVEQAECEYPVRIERYGLVRDSGGAGRYRGGMAVERSWRLLAGEANLSIRSDRRAHRPYGLYGGQPGAPSTNVLSRPGGDLLLPTMISTTLYAGELIYHHMAGGGGWGDPFERPADEVARDVRDDKVSLAAAREQYGVVLDESTLAVNEAMTAALRNRSV